MDTDSLEIYLFILPASHFFGDASLNARRKVKLYALLYALQIFLF